MTQTIITAGDASAGLAQSAGNDGTLVLQTGPAGGKVNALIADVAGKVSAPQGLVTGGLTGLTVRTTQATPLPGTVAGLNTAHGMTPPPVAAEIELVCLTAELGYAVGDVVVGAMGGNGSYTYPLSVAISSTTLKAVTGNVAAWMLQSQSTGINAALTPANWAWRFKMRTS
jgi:hypothetical protein